MGAAMGWGIDVSIVAETKRVGSVAVGVFENVTPVQTWSIMTLPESNSVFRVEERVRLETLDGGARWTEEVVFTAPVRVLFWKTWQRTRVWQSVDVRDPRHVRVAFRLLRSDMMSALTGSWQLEQLEAGGPGRLPRTRATYSFEMWPKGVPTSLRFMPGLMDAVRGAVRREAAQLFDKIRYISDKVAPGFTVQQAVRQAAGEVVVSGGSFKLLQQALLSRGASAVVPPLSHAISSDCAETPSAAGAGELRRGSRGSSGDDDVRRAGDQDGGGGGDSDTDADVFLDVEADWPPAAAGKPAPLLCEPMQRLAA